ncbi:MAG: DUF3108 domain-containing protein [Noviherbaspirillum sp.]
MRNSIYRPIPRLISVAVLASGLLFAQANANAAPRQKINLPPSAELTYTIKARQKGIPVEGDAVMRWSAGGNKFFAANEARAMLIGKIIDARSEGVIDAYGLAPSSFTEKRFRKDPTITSFDRSAKTIHFTASDESYPIKGGEQDQNSVIWQLIAMARATPARFKPGSSWNLFVAGQRHAEEWTFKVVTQEKISTPLGELNTLHISKLPPPDSQDRQVDIWLAPSLDWYPARLRYSDSNGDFIEQTLQKVSKKVP